MTTDLDIYIMMGIAIAIVVGVSLIIYFTRK